jgi:predicted enzyme related to lactoylglutathione lyase
LPIIHHLKLVVVLDSTDANKLADFWAQALHYGRARADYPYVLLFPVEEGAGPELLLQTVPEPKRVKNRMHLDIRVSDIEAESKRLAALGARRLSAGVIEEHGFRWLVMADPEGNEFCVCREPP